MPGDRCADHQCVGVALHFGCEVHRRAVRRNVQADHHAAGHHVVHRADRLIVAGRCAVLPNVDRCRGNLRRAVRHRVGRLNAGRCREIHRCAVRRRVGRLNAGHHRANPCGDWLREVHTDDRNFSGQRGVRDCCRWMRRRIAMTGGLRGRAAPVVQRDQAAVCRC